MKDYPTANAYHAPQNAATRVLAAVHDKIPAMHANDAPTLLRALHARTRELDAALTRVAILEAQVRFHEINPLVVAWNRLEATEQRIVFVAEMACPAAPTGRLREVGGLLDVLARLAGTYEVFSTGRIEVNAKEKKAS